MISKLTQNCWLAGFLMLNTSLLLASDMLSIEALLVTGGCCHDYEEQASLLTAFSQKQAHINWTIANEGGTDRTARVGIYDDPKWAEPYDVIVYNKCFPNVGNAEYLRKITQVHKAGKPAVLIHCSILSYDVADVDDWRELVGIESHIHDRETNYVVDNIAPDHPIMQGFPRPGWTTPSDELYIVSKTGPNTRVLATTFYPETGIAMPVIWTSLYGKGKVFGTTYGHTNETFSHPVFLELLTHGIIWAARAENIEAQH